MIYGYNKLALAGPSGPAVARTTTARPATGTGTAAARRATTRSPPRWSRTPWRPWRPRTCRGWATPTSCFVHPHQSRQLRDDPEFIEVTKYAAPGNFMLGEIGRLYGLRVHRDHAGLPRPTCNRLRPARCTTTRSSSVTTPSGTRSPSRSSCATRASWTIGREHGLAWYSIWGLGLITDQSVLVAETN